MTGRYDQASRDLSERLGRLAQETHAVQQGEFTLRSGQKSQFYLDGITLALQPEAAGLIARALVQHARESGANMIAGPALGAAPMVAAAVTHAGTIHGVQMRGAILREDWKPHGIEGLIAGRIEPGDQVLLVDDVLTTGTSLRMAREVLADTHAEIVRTVVLLDRSGQPGQAGLFSLIDISDLQSEGTPGDRP